MALARRPIKNNTQGVSIAAEPKEITTVISGTSNIKHLEANVDAVNKGLPANDLSAEI
ncbi:MAG: hypothetical protein CM1200mP39_10650 [Dehalococcoidia bacterium]|nr:MAG: hypothetical protein CM1200mP39_10650 [Dehalococcoidia bacterium]